MGATPLFYAIHQNNTAMVKLLTRHGARPDALITLEDEVRSHFLYGQGQIRSVSV